jgi:ribosomal protein L11 methyltransferase
MVSVFLECAKEDSERLVADLYELGTIGILEEDSPGDRCKLWAYFEDGVDTSVLSTWKPVVRREDARDWVEVSRSRWHPLLIGERFFLVPPWRDDPVPPGRCRLEMPAGLASGTGLHPATQLALEAIERFLQPGDCVLDLGTGSGILSMAAQMLGAGRIIACDIDPQAAEAASKVGVSVFVGSARSVRSSSIDLVAANINAATILSLAAEIRRVLRPSGRAILTGFPVSACENVRKRFIPVEAELEKGGWACLVTKR